MTSSKIATDAPGSKTHRPISAPAEFEIRARRNRGKARGTLRYGARTEKLRDICRGRGERDGCGACKRLRLPRHPRNEIARFFQHQDAVGRSRQRCNESATWIEVRIEQEW